MDPLDQLINPLARSAMWYGMALFCWWAFGFEFVVILLLAMIAKSNI